MSGRMKSLFFAVLVSLAVVPLSATPAGADVIFVGCQVPSLTSAIKYAPAGGTVSLAHACTYSLTAVDNSDSDGPNGLPLINKTLTLEGNHATITRAAGAPAFRILKVGTGGNLAIKALAITGGLATCPGDCDALGGGVLNRAALSLTGVQVSGNTASCADPSCLALGGGIANNGTVSVTSSQLSSNASACSNDCNAYGGAVGTYGGSFSLTSSQVSSNTATCSINCGVLGGGIEAAATTKVQSSTVTSNSATGPLVGGGGIYQLVAGTVTVSQASVSGNTPNNCAPPGSISGCPG